MAPIDYATHTGGTAAVLSYSSGMLYMHHVCTTQYGARVCLFPFPFRRQHGRDMVLSCRKIDTVARPRLHMTTRNLTSLAGGLASAVPSSSVDMVREISGREMTGRASTSSMLPKAHQFRVYHSLSAGPSAFASPDRLRTLPFPSLEVSGMAPRHRQSVIDTHHASMAVNTSPC